MSKSSPKATPGAVPINGFALKEIRMRTGVSVAATAEAMECDRSYITKIELGTSRRVSVDFYKRLLAFLSITDHRALLATAEFTESVA